MHIFRKKRIKNPKSVHFGSKNAQFLCKSVIKYKILVSFYPDKIIIKISPKDFSLGPFFVCYLCVLLVRYVCATYPQIH